MSPDFARRAAARWRYRNWFRGNYATWDEAESASVGYDDAGILDRVLAATLQVRSGQATFERDGVVFHESIPDVPVMAALDRVREVSGGRLRVLDFGGSLGSIYWRHRLHWTDCADFRWDVVEQPGFVEAGSRYLTGGPLRFFTDVCSAEAAGSHDVLLCSCVLQYLENPGQVLHEWRTLNIPFLLLNNVPLHEGRPDRICVQHVPPSIYPASYPVRFFNRSEFLARFALGYEIIEEFASEAVWPVGWNTYPSTGLLLKRRKSP